MNKKTENKRRNLWHATVRDAENRTLPNLSCRRRAWLKFGNLAAKSEQPCAACRCWILRRLLPKERKKQHANLSVEFHESFECPETSFMNAARSKLIISSTERLICASRRAPWTRETYGATYNIGEQTKNVAFYMKIIWNNGAVLDRYSLSIHASRERALKH